MSKAPHSYKDGVPVEIGCEEAQGFWARLFRPRWPKVCGHCGGDIFKTYEVHNTPCPRWDRIEEEHQQRVVPREQRDRLW